MATFRRRGERWQVQVRRKGFPLRTRTFDQRRDAERWGILQERDFDLMESRGETGMAVPDISLGELLVRYRKTVIPRKRCAYSEGCLVAAIERRSIASVRLRALSQSDIVRYRDTRLDEIGPGGVARELRLIQHALETARTSWGFVTLKNPVKDVRKPAEPRGRERRLAAGEEAALMAAVANCQNPYVGKVVSFALATGMRQGEILAMTWGNCDLVARVATLPQTKNGRPRTVPLSREAVAILNALQRDDGRVFKISTEALKQAWQRAVKRAKLTDLHFHDLRHEAISRLFEKGLEMPEVMMISGHTDPRMLLRYTHLNARKIVAKLDAA